MRSVHGPGAEIKVVNGPDLRVWDPGSLRLVCVGPGVKTDQERAQGEERLECCPDCEGLGATRVVEFYQGMYHDYAHTKHYKVSLQPH